MSVHLLIMMNLNGYTYYIDDSTNEQIFKKYIEDNDQIIEKHK